MQKISRKFSLIIFDLDGTLADTHQLIFDSFNFVMKKYKSVVLTPEEIMSYFGPPEEICINKMLGTDHFEEAWRDYLGYYDEHLDETTVFSGIPGLLKSLKASGLLLGIFTGKGKETTESTLKYHGIWELFDVVVTGSTVKNHKPHPEGVELALSKLKVRAEDAVVIGDSMSDYKAAGSSGTHFIAAMYDTFARNHFDNLDCTRVKSVDELARILSMDGKD